MRWLTWTLSSDDAVVDEPDPGGPLGLPLYHIAVWALRAPESAGVGWGSASLFTLVPVESISTGTRKVYVLYDKHTVCSSSPPQPTGAPLTSRHVPGSPLTRRCNAVTLRPEPR